MTRLPMRVRLTLLLLWVVLVALVALALGGGLLGRWLLHSAAGARLAALRDARAADVTDYFAQHSAALALLAQDETSAAAAARFAAEVAALDVAELDAYALATFYEAEFLPRLAPIRRTRLAVADFAPTAATGGMLQQQYIVNNPNPVGSKQELLLVGDGSGYDAAHGQYHAALRRFSELAAFYDVLLVAPATRQVVYSVRKEVTLGTGLATDAAADSNLAQVVARVLADGQPGEVQISDFERFALAADAPMAFFATGLFRDGALTGVLVGQIATDGLNAILSDGGRWQSAGLGASGEVYLVGADGLMRSDARLLAGAPAQFLEQLNAQGVAPATLQNIRGAGSTALWLPVATQPAERALAGARGTQQTQNYLGAPVVSAYSPLAVGGLTWGIVAEQPTREIWQPLWQQLRPAGAAAAVLLLPLALLGWLLAGRFLRPLHALVAATRPIAAGSLPGAPLPVTGGAEVGTLAGAFNHLLLTLRDHDATLRTAQAENERLLLSILPGPLAGRVRAGETNIADQMDDVALMVAELAGIQQFTRRYPDQRRAAALLNQIAARLEVAAGALGVARQPTIDNRIVAACGLNGEPAAERVARILAYALQAQAIVADFNRLEQARLALRIGIHSGPVLFALQNADKFRFELWGESVDVADKIVAAAAPEMILVSQEVYGRAGRLHRFAPEAAVQLADGRTWPVWQLLAAESAPTPDAAHAERLPASLRVRARRARFKHR